MQNLLPLMAIQVKKSFRGYEIKHEERVYRFKKVGLKQNAISWIMHTLFRIVLTKHKMLYVEINGTLILIVCLYVDDGNSYKWI